MGKWFGTMFTTVVPHTVVLRVWDAVFHSGLLALFRIALGVFLLIAPELLEAEKEGKEAVETIGPLQRLMAVDPTPLLQPLGSNCSSLVLAGPVDAVLTSHVWQNGSEDTRMK